MSRKQRTDTVAGELISMESALAGPLQPPEHVTLRPGDLPFWESIVLARARDRWDTSDLEIAANLARCKADIERLQGEIDNEGDVIENARGTPIVNPKHQLLETLSRRAVALSRMLHVHAEAKQGQSAKQGTSLAAEKAARKAIGDGKVAGNSLIARPQH